MNQNLGPLAPEIALAASAVAGLLLGSWLPRHRQWIIRALAAAACLAGLAAAALAATHAGTTDFGTSYAIDVATNTVRIVVLSAVLLVLGMSGDTFGGHRRETEFYVLLQLAALGTIVLAGANDLLLLFAGYLLASIPGYALAGFRKDAPGTEAALKYYLIGALLGVFMLAGITLLDGVGRTTSYPLLHAALARAPHGVVAAGLVAVLAGLLFKAGGVPAHFWVPDVTDGTSAPVAAFVTTVPKIGAFAALLRLLTIAIPAAVDWPLLVAVLAAATIADLAAFFDLVAAARLSISQAGYLLMAVAVASRSALAARSLLFYLAAYAATNLGAFAVVAEFPHAATLDSYRGLPAGTPAWPPSWLSACSAWSAPHPPACSSASSRSSPPPSTAATPGSPPSPSPTPSRLCSTTCAGSPPRSCAAPPTPSRTRSSPSAPGPPPAPMPPEPYRSPSASPPAPSCHY